jgi:hypothetical protein
VYDMYAWDQAPTSGSQNDDHADTVAVSKPVVSKPVVSKPVVSKPVQAVQVALDRRDNGGEASRQHRAR